MMNLLLNDHAYKDFGAPGSYSYMKILYKGADGIWTLNDKNTSKKLSKYEAEERSKVIRDQIINCASIISDIDPCSIEDYKRLDAELGNAAAFYRYTSILKYFQMVFPGYFPGMYKDETLLRCMQILGLRSCGKSKRIPNMGVISIFIRNCDINNIVFNYIYANEWQWEGTKETCPAYKENYASSSYTNNENIAYYANVINEIELSERAVQIEKSVDDLGLEGKEREAIVSVRVNQGDFRNLLLRRYSKCCLCGVSDPKLLRASHIKPWASSDPNEKLDADNGFLLCPNHDELFDCGYISFNDDGVIIISSKLSKNDQVFTNINNGMKISITEGNKRYLEFHRNHILMK